MKLTITALKDTERTSQRTGKPFTSRGIKCNEYGEKWLSGFAGKENESWKVGDTVEANVEVKGEYLNFSVPKATRQVGCTSGDLNRVEVKIDALIAQVATIGGILTDMRGSIGGLLQKKELNEPEF